MNEGQQYISFFSDGLPEAADEHGITYMERILSEKGGFTFLGDPLTGPPKIQSSDDVAFLFKNLENAATENVFAVLHKEDSSYSVLYLGTGTTKSSPVEIPLIVAAMKELNAESITLVHNHPSGALRASMEDKLFHAKLLESLPKGSINDSVIINLSSGKYATFTNTYDMQGNVAAPENIQEAKIYQFDRQKLYTNGEPRIKISSARQAAEFLSIQKSGTANKIHCVILDSASQISRYCLYDGNLSADVLANKIIADVGKYGNAVILSKNNQIIDNKTPQVENIVFANKISNLLESAGVTIVDFLEVANDERIVKEYHSLCELGLLSEPQELYGKISPNDDIKAINRQFEKEMELDRLKYINGRFNEELQRQIDGILPSGHTYWLGVPVNTLGNYVPSSDIELSATRLMEKSQHKRHAFDLKDVLNLPEALNNPIAIFKYGDRNKALNVIIELQKNNKNFLVGLSLNPSIGGDKLKIHSIRNVFPKDNAEWLNWIAQGKSIYLNKEKIQVQINQQRMTAADVNYLNLELVTKLVKDFDNTKYMLNKKRLKEPPQARERYFTNPKNNITMEQNLRNAVTPQQQAQQSAKGIPTVSVNEEMDPITNFANNVAYNRKPPIPEERLGTVMEQLKGIGVNLETLRNNGDLNKMLYYGKSGLVNMYLNTGDGTGTKASTQGKLSIIKDADGNYQLKTYPQRTLNVDKYFSHEFTETQKENLLKHGNAGEVINVSFGEGQDPKKVLVSLDKDTNNLHSQDVSKIHVHEKYFGVEITPEMKAQILEGKSVEIKGMVSPKNPNNTFDGKVMYNAGEKKLAIVAFDNHQMREVTKIGNVQLTQEQVKNFAAGDGVYLKGFQRKGQEGVSDLYVQRDKDGSFKFDRNNPNPAKEPEKNEKNLKKGERKAQPLSEQKSKNQTAQKQAKAPKVPKGKSIKPRM